MIKTSQPYTRKSNNNLTIFSFGSTLCAKLHFDCISSWSLKTLAKVANIKAKDATIPFFSLLVFSVLLVLALLK